MSRKNETLCYVGSRVEIDHHGILYKPHKEDKYIYLPSALVILQGIDNDYDRQSTYIQHIGNQSSVDDIEHILDKYEKDFRVSIEKEQKHYEEKIQHKINFVRHLPNMSAFEKEAWIKNIEMMKSYQINRAMNKIYYMHVIQDIVHLIQHKRIKEITVPFNKVFFHVFNTIKGALITHKKSLDATVCGEQNKDGQLILKMSIK